MRVLIDTNMFLWCLAGEIKRLSARAVAALENETTVLLLSAVSLWEIALKVRAGKLELPEEWQFFSEHMTALGVQHVLPVEARHVFGLFSLPDHHRDPFDRLLISQCRAEGLTLIASDEILRRYDVRILW